jgi:alkyl hydroperoxide reductase subunit AhpF
VEIRLKLKITKKFFRFSMISKDIKEKLKEIFNKRLKDSVDIVVNLDNTKLSEDIKKLIEEISSTTDKIKIIEENKDALLKPYIKIKKGSYENLIYYGLPAGGEFQTFIEAIIAISTQEHRIPDRQAEFIKEINKKVNIKLFITKSCGWCPPTIKQAIGFSIINNNIFVNVIDCFDFPEEAKKYNVSTVPKVVS